MGTLGFHSHTLTLNNALAISLCLIAFHLLISSIEMLRAKGCYGSKSFIPWNNIRNSYKIYSNTFFDFLFSDKHDHHSMRILLLIRMLSGFGIFISLLTHAYLTISLLIGFFSSLILTMRSGAYGEDGSFQIILILQLSLLISLIVHTKIAILAAFWFLSLQLCLIYLTSGGLKLLRKDWLNGKYVQAVLNSRQFGHAKVGKFFLEHPLLAKLSSITFILVELIFPIAFLIGGKFFYLWIILTFCFHVTVAFTMGLSRFVWAIAALYPIIIYTRLALF